MLHYRLSEFAYSKSNHVRSYLEIPVILQPNKQNTLQSSDNDTQKKVGAKSQQYTNRQFSIKV